MKGLILKELYLIKSFSKQYVLLMVLMGAWSVFVHNISFVAIYVMVLGSSMVLSTTSMDEAVSFHKFAVTMPVNARTLVKSKYVILFLTVGVGELLVWLFSAAVNLLPTGSMEIVGMEGMIVTGCLFLSANAASIPVMFKVGVTKSRYTYLIVMVVIGGVILGGYKASKLAGLSLDDMLTEMEWALNLTAVILAAVIVAVSYFISVKIVQKKEW
ncbi:MAG: ABC-2 transporter permease [Lachnospiraceae bacterium]|jgi:ABC-2 type transport system permease protein|nr:ABC-2 transporter permease [Lachnospiraceae bacterium]MCI9328074.1 ABC-2 transporter permease [Lachnospiraceae bacterium]